MDMATFWYTLFITCELVLIKNKGEVLEEWSENWFWVKDEKMVFYMDSDEEDEKDACAIIDSRGVSINVISHDCNIEMNYICAFENKSIASSICDVMHHKLNCYI